MSGGAQLAEGSAAQVSAAQEKQVPRYRNGAGHIPKKTGGK